MREKIIIGSLLTLLYSTQAFSQDNNSIEMQEQITSHRSNISLLEQQLKKEETDVEKAKERLKKYVKSALIYDIELKFYFENIQDLELRRKKTKSNSEYKQINKLIKSYGLKINKSLFQFKNHNDIIDACSRIFKKEKKEADSLKNILYIEKIELNNLLNPQSKPDQEQKSKKNSPRNYVPVGNIGYLPPLDKGFSNYKLNLKS